MTDLEKYHTVFEIAVLRGTLIGLAQYHDATVRRIAIRGLRRADVFARLAERHRAQVENELQHSRERTYHDLYRDALRESIE